MDSLTKLAGEALLIGLEGQAVGHESQSLLAQVRPGGLIFFQRNMDSDGQFSSFVSEASAALRDSMPFLAVDLEGGTVDRFRELIAPLPAVEHAAAVGLGRELGRVAGRELLAFGLNADFAPVLDLGLSASKPVLTTRTAGATASSVISFAKDFLGGLAESGVLGCGKHFPGLGGGTLDSHLDMPSIERAMPDMWDHDLLPYRQLAGDLPMVMVAHAWYPQLEKALGWKGVERPASLSPEIAGSLLRQRIGFEGLILCDDLEMGGVLKGRTIEEAAVAAIEAGCDVLLVCRHADNVVRAHESLVREAVARPAFRAKLEAAVGRIRTVKAKQHAAVGRGMLPKPALQQVQNEVKRMSELIRHRLLLQNGPSSIMPGLAC